MGEVELTREGLNAVACRVCDSLEARRAELAEQFARRPTGAEYCRWQSYLFDAVVVFFYHLATRVVEARRGRPEAESDVCVAAVGGYGRAHLAPWSDIDLVFIPGREGDAYIDDVVREMLGLLNTTLAPPRLPQVAHSYRPLGDLGLIDHQTATALLEARFVAGNHALFSHFMHKAMQSIEPVEFVHLNSSERRAIWRDRRQSLYAVEPNLKSGPGGLRDFHAAVWVAKVVFRVEDWDVLSALRARGVITDQDQGNVLSAIEFLLRCRNWLHGARGQKLDTLHVTYQADMAHALGYAGDGKMAAEELLMRDYYLNARTVAHFSRRLLAICQEQRLDYRHGLYVEHWTLHPSHDRIFHEDPERLVAVFQESQRLDLPLSLWLERLVETAAEKLEDGALHRPSVGARVLDILAADADVARTLRRMLRLGVLERLLPEFAPAMLFLPSDRAHEYSVGEHSMKVVEELQRLRSKPVGEDERLLYEAFRNLREPEVLVFAGLFHDVGKLDGQGEHAVTGQAVARSVAQRLGMPDLSVERVEFLVREHLTMMHTARLRALSLPDTIDEFLRHLPAREPLDALDMLTLLTYADTRSVGEGVLKETDRRLLMELFAKAGRWIQDRPPEGDSDEVRQTLGRRLGRAPAMRDTEPASLQHHLARLPVWYAANTPPALVAKHIGYLDRLAGGENPVVEFYNALGVLHTEVTVCTPDRLGLLRDIAGTMTANNLDIYLLGQDVAAAAGDEAALSIGSVWVDDHGQRLSTIKRERLADDLGKVMRGEQSVEDLLASRGRGLPDEVVVYSVEVNNAASQQYSVVSIRAADQRGLLYRMASALFAERLDIRVAKVTTWRNAAEDAFYVVSHATGDKLDDATAELVGERIARRLRGEPVDEVPAS